jgi:uncharacterized protein
VKWSKYNLLFRSEKYGHLLYNSLTNSFAALDEASHKAVESIKASPESYDFTNTPGLYLQLLMMKVLVEDREEKDLLNINRLQRLNRSFDDTVLTLTIVPTLFCNFDCAYCFEQFRRPVHMSETVEEGIINFIKKFRKTRHLAIDWFGGEPLIRFDTIRRLTEQIKGMGIAFDASLVTNGYLLDEVIMQSLKDLHIKLVQITIDGPEDIHDKRRPLLSGKGTFKQIISNLERLVDYYDEDLLLRVNIDRANYHRFQEIHDYLKEKIKGDKVYIATGCVVSVANPYADCFNRNERTAFLIDAYRDHGIVASEFYPETRNHTCTATEKNSFVIGPEGEIYNCWGDIGDRDLIVGSIFENTKWNMASIANYMVGTDPFDEPECRDCFFLPVCNGGCPKFWLEKKESGHSCRDVCVEFKDRLPEWLEISYELRQRRMSEKESSG